MLAIILYILGAAIVYRMAGRDATTKEGVVKPALNGIELWFASVFWFGFACYVVYDEVREWYEERRNRA